MNIFANIISHMEQGQGIVLKSHYSPQGTKREIVGLSSTPAPIAVETLSEGYCITESFLPKPRLILLGGGHISTPLVEMAKSVGFAVWVFDDRPSFANTARFPLASKVICDDFANLDKHIQLTPTDYICVLTRGHQHDATCLKKIYDSVATTAYVGMIGSKRRVLVVKGELLKQNPNYQQQLDSLHAPIGLAIGAITPEEIAVSILGQLIGVKRNFKGDKNFKGEYTAPIELLSFLAENTQVAHALVTILETKGSTPRQSGAKMIVTTTGEILGSIGGGCTEAQAIQIARDVLDVGGFQKLHLDLADAEELGMVCGGSMEIFIEKVEPIV